VNTAPEARPPEPLDHAVLQEFSAMRMHVEQVRAIVLDAVTKLGDGFERISSQSLSQQGLLEKTLHSVDDSNAEAGTFARFVEQFGDLVAQLTSNSSKSPVAIRDQRNHPGARGPIPIVETAAARPSCQSSLANRADSRELGAVFYSRRRSSSKGLVG